MIIEIAGRDAEIVNGSIGDGDFLQTKEILLLDESLRPAARSVSFARVVLNDGSFFLAKFVDAPLQTLYVNRPLVNADEVMEWAKSAGFATTVQDMHVTVAFSKKPVDWSQTEPDRDPVAAAGDARSLERFGDDAVVLRFDSPELQERWREFKDIGASWDYASFQPHVTISYEGPDDSQLAGITPYAGDLVFGPEEFAEIDPDWEDGVQERKVDFIQDPATGRFEGSHGSGEGQAEGSGGGGRGGARSPDEAARRATSAASGHPKLEGLPDKPLKVGDHYLVPGPYGRAKDTAEKYLRSAGLPFDPPKQYLKVDKERATRVAAAFDAMKHDPDNPAVQASYAALAKETLAQWQAIKESGLKVEWIKPGQADPYAETPRLAAQDVIDNNHWWGFPTDQGFGSGPEAEAAMHNNPMLQPTDEVVDGRKLVVNDVFRIVHDYFGHFKEGVGFRADGEENAWRSHAAMYSDLARGAMTSETRGQNSWVNYGPFGESNRTASAGDTHYAPQKIGLMPEWTWNDGRGDIKAKAFDPSEPRDESGKWTDGGGSDGGGDGGGGGREHPGAGYSKDAYVKNGVIHTSNVNDAAKALFEDRKVELKQPDQVSTLLEHLGQISKNMIAMGQKAPIFNLCNVSVAGTNLFCAESKGIPRVQMPQLEDVGKFRAHLDAAGYKTSEGKELASHLRATQNELNGGKVAAVAEVMKTDEALRNRQIIISKDNYVLDGHHSWAAKVGLDAADGNLSNDTKMNVIRVDIGIIPLLEEANKFTGGKGGKDISKSVPFKVRYSEEVDYIQDPSTGLLHGSHGHGGGDGAGGAAVAAVGGANVETTAHVGVALGTAAAKARGDKPLQGSDGHPAIISSAQVSATKANKLHPTITNSNQVYTQPTLTRMRGTSAGEKKEYDEAMDVHTHPDLYPNLRPSQVSGSADDIARNVIEHMKQNILFFYNKASEGEAQAKVWYFGARSRVDGLVNKFKITDASATGVVAVLSPRNDWDNNVYTAEKMVQIYSTKQNHAWDEKMEAKRLELIERPTLSKYRAEFEAVQGKKLSELTDATAKATWIRIYDEAHASHQVGDRAILPFKHINADGSLDGPVMTTAKKPAEASASWGKMNALARAVKIMEAKGDRVKISALLGTKHKVRAFYNDILDPFSKNGDVVADIHAIGAAWGAPLNDHEAPVLHGFSLGPEQADTPKGWISVGKNGYTGISGTYPLYVEAYRQAAAEAGVLPHQMQSVVWTVKRNAFNSLKQEAPGKIREMWESYRTDPKQKLSDVQQKVWDYVHGEGSIRPPQH